MSGIFAGLPPDARIGIFGGTFDPIHLGHLILAEEARVQLQLDRVYLVPAGDPPHKQAQRVTPVQHRVRMVELATAESMELWVSRVDADRPGPHYSVETVQLIQRDLIASVGNNVQIFFLMGLDSLRDLPMWHQPQWLLAHCQLAVLARPGVEIDWPAMEKAMPGIRDRIMLLDMPLIDISSRAIRNRLANGRSAHFQVPKAVLAYLHKHQLYVDCTATIIAK